MDLEIDLPETGEKKKIPVIFEGLNDEEIPPSKFHNRQFSLSPNAKHRRMQSQNLLARSSDLLGLELDDDDNETDEKQPKQLRWATEGMEDTIELPSKQEDKLPGASHHTPQPSHLRINAKKGILRGHGRHRSTADFLKGVEERKTSFLANKGKGSYLYKINKKRTLNKRYFYISADGSELCWRKKKSSIL